METFSSICSLYIWHAREVSSVRTSEFESTHGRKMDDPIPHMQGWINGHISIEVAIS